MDLPAKKSIRQIVQDYRQWVLQTNPFHIQADTPIPMNILKKSKLANTASASSTSAAGGMAESKGEELATGLPSETLAEVPSTANSSSINDDPMMLHMQVVDEVAEGILEYFNLSVGALLLYSTERLQYKGLLMSLEPKGVEKDPEAMYTSTEGNATGVLDTSTGPKELVDLYGANHLLRLFTKLPEMISQLPMAPGTISLLKEHFTMMLTFLDTFSKELFQGDKDFSNVSPDQLLQLKSIQ